MSLRFAAALLLCGSLHGQIRAGAAKRVITPDLKKSPPVYIAGFGQNRVATGVHDDLFTRCMALQAGSQRPLVICAVDAIGLFFDDVQKIRAKVNAHLVVASTHDHESPDTMGLWGSAAGKSGINEAYNQRVIDLTAEAANASLKSLANARIRLGKVQSKDLEALYDDSRPPVRHDSELTVLVAESSQGKPIGVLTNWNNHPEALDSKNTELTADYLAYFHPVIEKKFGGTSVFLNGAVGGMQSPLGAKVIDPASGQPAQDGTFRFAELVGNRVASFAMDAVTQAKPASITSILFREELIRIPMANVNFQMAAKAGIFGDRKKPNADMTSTTPVGYIRFDGEKGAPPVLEVALIPGEMYPELSVGGIERYAGADFPDAPLEPRIKQQMRAPFRMLFGLANDEVGYIIPKAEWDEKAPWLQNASKKWYGEVNSLGSEAGPMINATFERLAKR